MNRIRLLGYALVALLSALPASLRAEKYALIAGVGKFLYLEKSDLQGPRPDAETMVQVLNRYGFQRSNMIVLLDQEGTRAAILNGIDKLAGIAKNGDLVVIYFSGHGTSGYQN